MAKQPKVIAKTRTRRIPPSVVEEVNTKEEQVLDEKCCPKTDPFSEGIYHERLNNPLISTTDKIRQTRISHKELSVRIEQGKAKLAEQEAEKVLLEKMLDTLTIELNHAIDEATRV